MRVIYHILLLILFGSLDFLLTILSFAFYNPNFKFEFNFEKLWTTFDISNYSFWTSPLDFLGVVIARQLLIVISLFYVKFDKKPKKYKVLKFVIDSIAIACYLFSVVKVLCFDETNGFTSQFGVIFNILFSIIFSLLVPIIIRQSIGSGQFNYQPLINEQSAEEETTTAVENGGSTPSTSSDSDSDSDSDDEDDKEDEDEKEERKKEKAERLPFKTHIWCIVKLCAPQWKWYILSYVLLLISTILSLIEPAIYSNMMSNAIKMKSFDVLKHSCYLLLVVELLESTFSTAKTMVMSCAEAKTSCHVRISLFKAILHQDISFFDENKTGQLMSRITHDTDSISNSLPGYLETLTSTLINFFGALPIMIYFSWQLTVTAFITFPITFMMSKFYGLYIEKMAEKKNTSNAKSNDTVQEVLSSIRTVRSFGNERNENQKYEGRINDWYRISMKSVFASGIFNYGWGMIWNIEDVMVYLYGGYLTLNGRLKPEYLLSYVFYQWRLHSALNTFSNMFSNLMNTIGSSRKVIQLLNRQPQMDYTSGTERPPIIGEIRFDDIEFSYPTRRDVSVLKGLQLRIEPGKTTALVGPSGQGKSTMISLIEQFYSPTSGHILLDGNDIANIEHEYYHSKIALVAQEPTLFSGTIRENIMYGMEDGTEEDMLRAARMANVHEFVDKMKKGYNTKCGEKGVTMSGGQKQRIAIARALIRDPNILILDEATSALDTESESLVQEALNNCAKDRTVIVIAHRLSTVKNADKIAVIENGVVTEMGNHEELMNNEEGMYFKLVSKQLEPKKKEIVVETF